MTQSLRVLLIEDSVEDTEFTLSELTRSGYDPVWERVETEEGMAAALDRQTWDIVLAKSRISGIEAPVALALLADHQPDTSLIVISEAVSEEVVLNALSAHARGRLFMTNRHWLGPTVELGLIEAAEKRAHRRVHETLRSSEERYRHMVEIASEGIGVLDAASSVTYANARLAEMLGYMPEAMIGQPAEAFIFPEDLPELRDRWRTRVQQQDMRFEQRFRRQDGGECCAFVSSTPLRDANGTFTGVYVMFTDITELKRAGEALRAREELNRQLVEVSPEAVYIHQDGRICYVNPAGVRLFGARSADELVGQPFIERVLPEQREMVAKRARQVIEEQRIVTPVDEVFLRLDGSTINAEVTASPFTYLGRPAALVTVRDISDRVAGERQARLQRDLAFGLAATQSLDDALQQCLDTALQVPGFDSGGIYLVDPGASYLELVAAKGLSSRFVQIGQRLGADSPHWRLVMTGESVFRSLHEIDLMSASRRRAEGLEWVGITPITHQGRIIGCFNMASHAPAPIPVTSQRWLEAIAAQIGQVIARLQAKEESTQRNRQLSALNALGAALASTLDLLEVYRIAYEHLSTLVDTDGFAISLYDPPTRTLRAEFVVSDGASIDVSQFPPLHVPDDALHGRGRAIATQQPEIVLDQEAAAAEAQGEEVITVGERPFSAAYVPMVVNGLVTGLLEVQSSRLLGYGPAETALLTPAANQIGLAIENARLYQEVQRELGERQRAELSLQQTLGELQRSNADLEQFAYIASHDLQEPLRMVASFMQLLAERYEGQLDQDADDFIGFAVDGASRMQAMINSLLEYSRVHRFGRPFEKTEGDAVLSLVLRDLDLAIVDAGAVVTHDPLPSVWVDPIQFGQILQNLITNAIKFRGAEPPHVHISARLQDAEWQFSVADNGIGIAPEHQDQIFGIFKRLHSRNEYPGEGIGLAVCKRVIERHGGRIWVESTLGQGSTFYFTIPVRSESEDR